MPSVASTGEPIEIVIPHELDATDGSQGSVSSEPSLISLSSVIPSKSVSIVPSYGSVPLMTSELLSTPSASQSAAAQIALPES